MQASASEILESLDINSWPGPCSAEIVPNAVDSLESGKLLYAPRLHFELSESECRFLSLECPWEFLSGAEPGAGMGLGCGDDGIPPRDARRISIDVLPIGMWARIHNNEQRQCQFTREVFSARRSG